MWNRKLLFLLLLNPLILIFFTINRDSFDLLDRIFYGFAATTFTIGVLLGALSQKGAANITSSTSNDNEIDGKG